MKTLIWYLGYFSYTAVMAVFCGSLSSIANAGELDFAKKFFEQQQENYIREKIANTNSRSQCNNSGIVYLYRPSTQLVKCANKGNKCAIIYHDSTVYDLDGRKTILTLTDLSDLEILRCATTDEMLAIKSNR